MNSVCLAEVLWDQAMFWNLLNKRAELNPSPHSCYVTLPSAGIACVQYLIWTSSLHSVYVVWLTVSTLCSQPGELTEHHTSAGATVQESVHGSWAHQRAAGGWCFKTLPQPGQVLYTGCKNALGFVYLLFLFHLLVCLALTVLPLSSLTIKQEDLCLYESGGNISKYDYAFVISAWQPSRLKRDPECYFLEF